MYSELSRFPIEIQAPTPHAPLHLAVMVIFLGTRTVHFHRRKRGLGVNGTTRLGRRCSKANACGTRNAHKMFVCRPWTILRETHSLPPQRYVTHDDRILSSRRQR